MAVDIGYEAINRAGGSGEEVTYVAKGSPATIAGVITSIDIWADEDITGLIVGSFYTTNGNTLKCRDSEAIAGTITAGSKVTKVVSIAVEIGDYIGCYFTGGSIERDISGYSDIWAVAAEYIDPDDEAVYSLLSDDAISLGGYIGAPPAGIPVQAFMYMQRMRRQG